eukprot:551790_1
MEANQSTESNLLRHAPPAMVNPYKQRVYLTIKAKNHKRWEDPFMFFWDSRFDSLAAGTGEFESAQWISAVKSEVAAEFNIHDNDMVMKYKLKADVSSRRNKGASRLATYVYSEVNPIRDTIFIYINDSCEDSDCPVNETDETSRKRKHISSDEESDSKPKKKKSEKNKKKKK